MFSDPAPYYETDSITLRNRQYCTLMPLPCATKQTVSHHQTDSIVL